ncbi:response regulator [Pseudomonas sp. B22129]|uniref:response regulator n=1 Tax=Pseudomonas sp. B22129 TaxID=3235111 RepID=UPI003783EAFA
MLVVDDHYTYRLLLGSLLEKLGVAHLCCSDGRQALQALAAEPFDLVLSDCRMPVMDGYALTRELRRREQAEGRPPITVLGLSASLGPEGIRQCVACGMDGWLVKPIGLAQLRKVLRCWLPQYFAVAGKCGSGIPIRNSALPGRASLIEAFGSWDVVERMLVSLIRETHADLAVLAHARATPDARMVTQCLHRLVGSMAFLGDTGLEASTMELINDVHSTGVAVNRSALDEFRQEVERYLNYLTRI